MTPTDELRMKCPSCGSIYVVDMENGIRFCPECRNEWNPRDVPAPSATPTVEEMWKKGAEKLAARDDTRASYDTVVEVTHDDGGSGNMRTDRYVHHTTHPHTVNDALDMAMEHFAVAVGSHVTEAVVAERIPDTEPSTRAEREAALNVQDWPLARARETPDGTVVDSGPDPDSFDEEADVRATLAMIDSFPEPDETPSDEDRVLAAAYLSTLTGTGLTLEGGQRATLLDFVDDDNARVQLATGEVVVVGFNDILHADQEAAVEAPADVEVDDETAEQFGGAALIMACLVIEAGAASIEGEGLDSHLVEPLSGWFIPDEDAIPLMEQAAAAAVAMLIQTFALPRADIASMVAHVREQVDAVPSLDIEHEE